MKANTIQELERREEEGTSSPGIRLDSAFEEFLSLRDIRPVTINARTLTFRAVYVPAFGEKLVDEIEGADVERFLRRVGTERSVRGTTKKKYLSELRSFFRWAKWRKYCTEDPTE